MKDCFVNKYLTTIERDYNYYVSSKLKSYNLGKHDIRVLKEINASSGLSQNEVCARIKEDKITVSKSVKNLVLQGYVEKLTDAEDKRITRLYITESGKINRKEILSIIKEVNEVFLKDFSEENKKLILELLSKVSENIHEEVIKIKEEK